MWITKYNYILSNLFYNNIFMKQSWIVLPFHSQLCESFLSSLTSLIFWHVFKAIIFNSVHSVYFNGTKQVKLYAREKSFFIGGLLKSNPHWLNTFSLKVWLLKHLAIIEYFRVISTNPKNYSIYSKFCYLVFISDASFHFW